MEYNNKGHRIFSLIVSILSILLLIFMVYNRFDSLKDIIGQTFFIFIYLFMGLLDWIVLGIVYGLMHFKQKTFSKSKIKVEIILYIVAIFIIPISVVLSYVLAAMLGIEGDGDRAMRLTIPYIISYALFTIKFIVDVIVYNKLKIGGHYENN